eukprot:1095188-Pelagomonas_calceolata.AAC.5
MSGQEQPPPQLLLLCWLLLRSCTKAACSISRSSKRRQGPSSLEAAAAAVRKTAIAAAGRGAVMKGEERISPRLHDITKQHSLPKRSAASFAEHRGSSLKPSIAGHVIVDAADNPRHWPGQTTGAEAPFASAKLPL